MRLVHALLVAMVGAPNASLTRRELCRRFGEQFDAARRAGVIEELPGPVEYVADDAGRRRRVVVEELGAVLIDEDEPDDELDRWPLEEVRRWRAAPLQVIACLRSRHALTGDSGLVRPDLWLLGRAGERGAIVLALASEASLSEAADYARGVLGVASAIVVASPTSAMPLRAATSYRSEKVTFTRLNEDLEFVPPLEELSTDDTSGALSWFKYNDDFQVVVSAGRLFNLTLLQALIVRRLHQAAVYDLWSVPWSELRAIADGADFHPTRMNDVFRRVPHWPDLLESPRFGFWQLRRPPSQH